MLVILSLRGDQGAAPAAQRLLARRHHVLLRMPRSRWAPTEVRERVKLPSSAYRSPI